MEVKVKNCNNIDIANIHICENKLNIKLAPNGTGKSTIAKAIELSINKPEDLEGKLLPFKYRENNEENILPIVEGLSNIHSVMCFNEEYVRQFNFKQDELISNSFDIFIRNDEYKAIEQEIDVLVSETRQVFKDNQELELLILVLKELGNAFKLTKTGISQSSTGMKGLKEGNKIQHIPEGLESYKVFIQSDKSVDWVSWQTQGCEFNDLSENCPFCTSDTSEKKELIKRVSEEYDKNTIKNLVEIIRIVEKLGDFLSNDVKNKLKDITNLKDGLEREHVTYIVNIKNQIDDFVEKLERLRGLSCFQFSDNEKVIDKLESYKLDLQFFSVLDSEHMKLSIEPINNSLIKLIEKAGLLQGKINIQRKKMRLLIEKHQENINNFLSYAGYKYKVEITDLNEESKLKLKHLDYSEPLTGGDQHLSFGEKNAFSIVLFMYECLSKNSDIIILDDPISSFDKNKKYAILEMLFRRDSENCLKNKTVIMLTHDVEPIIDTVKSLSQKFGNLTKASFLKLSNGTISEVEINKNDFKTFTDICKEVIESRKHDIIKLVYLRRNFEIINENCDGYQVLSNVLHKRVSPIDKREQKDSNDCYPPLAQNKFQNGCTEIKSYINNFNYTSILSSLNNVEELKKLYNDSTNGYEKLQIFRLICTGEVNTVIQKFVNETYHIENEFVCQLSPSNYDTIPEYVIKECDRVLALI